MTKATPKKSLTLQKSSPNSGNLLLALGIVGLSIFIIICSVRAVTLGKQLLVDYRGITQQVEVQITDCKIHRYYRRQYKWGECNVNVRYNTEIKTVFLSAEKAGMYMGGGRFAMFQFEGGGISDRERVPSELIGQFMANLSIVVIFGLMVAYIFLRKRPKKKLLIHKK